MPTAETFWRNFCVGLTTARLKSQNDVEVKCVICTVATRDTARGDCTKEARAYVFTNPCFL